MRNISKHIVLCSCILHGEPLNINSAPTPINFLVTLRYKGRQGPLEFKSPCAVATSPSHFCQLWVDGRCFALRGAIRHQIILFRCHQKDCLIFWAHLNVLEHQEKKCAVWMELRLEHIRNIVGLASTLKWGWVVACICLQWVNSTMYINAEV